ncbi:hypothetical protein ARMGADRAFT_1039735 [Armillaria gallica]|uniref:Uncharacterized protein n=1 Tax=Armillaria gallica TaxID=47427 RepID=A0A2H3CCK8_ARMGA|nr:hypothetical protein ARMGADRAFT_1039735 [Armillaria gallica]
MYVPQHMQQNCMRSSDGERVERTWALMKAPETVKMSFQIFPVSSQIYDEFGGPPQLIILEPSLLFTTMPDHEDTAKILVPFQHVGLMVILASITHPKSRQLPMHYHSRDIMNASLSEILTFSVVRAIAVMLTAVTTKNAADAMSFPTNHADHEVKGPLQCKRF